MLRNSGAKKNKFGNWNSNLTLGTLIVYTLYNTERVHIETGYMERYGSRSSLFKKLDGKKLDPCGDRRQFGPGFIIRKSRIPAIIKLKSMNPRMTILILYIIIIYIIYNNNISI